MVAKPKKQVRINWHPELNKLKRIRDIYLTQENPWEYWNEFQEDLDRLQEPNSQLRLMTIKVENRTVGFCLYELPRFETAMVTIVQIVVNKPQRGRGYGRWMINALTVHLTEHGIDLCMLSTVIPEFYEKLGFTKIPTHRKQWHLMVKSLNDTY